MDRLAQRCHEDQRRVGVLLWGPPGCGKTHLIEVMAYESGFELKKIDATTIFDKYVGESEKAVRGLFESAEAIAQSGKPVAIFIDEADSLLPSRDSTSEHKVGVVNAFLTYMTKEAQYPIMVVLATNRRDKMDATAMRDGRVNDHIFVGLPGIQGYEAIWRMYLDKQSEREKVRVCKKLSMLTLAQESHQIISPATIKAICQEAGDVSSDFGGEIEQEKLIDVIRSRSRKGRGELIGFNELLAKYGESGLITHPDLRKYLEDEGRRKRLSLTQSPDEAIEHHAPRPRSHAPFSFRNIVGMENAKILIHSTLMARIAGKSGHRRTMFLLYGPPGYGKTTFARATATHFDCGFRLVKGADFADKYRGEPTKRLQTIFDTALSQAETSGKPMILFFDEADSMFLSRDDSESSRLHGGALATFLTATEGFGDSSNVIVILSTNRPDNIDSAVHDRVTHPIRVWPSKNPKASAEVWRRTFLRELAEREGISLSKDIDWKRIGQSSHSKVLSYRQISVIVRDIVEDAEQAIEKDASVIISGHEIRDSITGAPDGKEELRKAERVARNFGKDLDKTIGPRLYKKYMEDPKLCEELNLDPELMEIRTYDPYDDYVEDISDEEPEDIVADEPMDGLRGSFDVESSAYEGYSYFPKALLKQLAIAVEGRVEIDDAKGNRAETNVAAHDRPSKTLIQLSTRTLEALRLPITGNIRVSLVIRKIAGDDDL
jgi:SpoVK/Ycf46/Vps4 family AAA+-type ATPase